MSKRREIEGRLRALGEIKDILGAMKNLSLMETRKLTRFLSSQQRVVENIESALADFLTFYPLHQDETQNQHNVYLLIGSERGFCGDFNEAVLRAFESSLQKIIPGEPVLVVVGQRLSAGLANDPRVAAYLEGPNIVEEVDSVLTRLMETLNTLKTDFYPVRLTAFYHTVDENGISVTTFQPFKQFERKKVPFSYPPRLNLSPPLFVAELVDHYLFNHIHGLFYSSLMAENLRRLQHMDNAIRNIEKDSSELLRKRNTLRQEEITEEIEIILLSAEALRNV